MEEFKSIHDTRIEVGFYYAGRFRPFIYTRQNTPAK